MKKRPRNRSDFWVFCPDIFFGSHCWLRGWDLSCPIKNIVVSGAQRSSLPMLLVFSLVALASSFHRMRSSSKPTTSFGVRREVQFQLALKTKKHPIGCFFILVAGVGFEPHGLRVMSPTSYQAALPRDILVPETGIEPVRDVSLTGF